MHYWSNVLRVLRDKVGADVIVTSVPGSVAHNTLVFLTHYNLRTGSISARADMLHQQLRSRALGRGVNLLAHSMGGLDCRHLITHIQPEEYVPLSLTSISTPHRGSPFMDWCAVSDVRLNICKPIEPSHRKILGLGNSGNKKNNLLKDSIQLLCLHPDKRRPAWKNHCPLLRNSKQRLPSLCLFPLSLHHSLHFSSPL